MLSLEARLLLDRTLRAVRNDSSLESGIGWPLDRHAVGPVVDPLHGALHCLEVLLEAIDHRLTRSSSNSSVPASAGCWSTPRKFAIAACLRAKSLQLLLDPLLLCSQGLRARAASKVRLR